MDDHATTQDTAPQAQITPTPPLPPDVRDRILSHLVPPALPLPHDLLSRTFLERLTFLPPDPDELDAHLTPFPPSTISGSMAKDARNPQALYVALEQLSGSLKVSDPEYSNDGMTISRVRLAPEFGEDGAVDTYFEHEDGEQGRGWVYRGATLGGYAGGSNLGDQWDWKNRVEDVRYNTTGFGYSGGGDDQAPEDYWAGFTPPSGHAELPGDDNEDDYWAQYGAGGQSTGHTQPPSRGDRGLEADQEDANTDPEPLTPPTATIAAPDPAATLSLLLHGLNADAAKAETQHAEDAASPETPPRPSVFEQKLRAKVRAQLMSAWTAFSAGQDAEAAAYEWLKVGREIANRPSWGGASGSASQDTFGDVRPAVLRARVEAAKDVHDILDNEPAGRFFHLCEEAIRVRNPLAEGGGEEQDRYDYE